MPILVKIYNKELDTIIGINIYYSMELAIKHSKGLISYYDLRRSGNKYSTYKKYISVSKLSMTNFLFLTQILCFYNNNNASSCN